MMLLDMRNNLHASSPLRLSEKTFSPARKTGSPLLCNGFGVTKANMSIFSAAARAAASGRTPPPLPEVPTTRRRCCVKSRAELSLAA
jgi:hypothetical protein